MVVTGAPAPRRHPPIAILSAGVIAPIGGDLDSVWASLVTGASGISAIERFDVRGLRVGKGGEIKKFTFAHRRPPRGGRAAALLLAAADDLRARVALDVAPERLGIVVGTALGGVEEGERALVERGPGAAAAARYDCPARTLAAHLGAAGPVLTVSTACASGATALGVAADLLRDDRADLVVAGGYDALCRFVMRGFDALRSLTRDRVRPFDRRRSGVLLGEGAALVAMAREGSSPLGWLLGHASASDGAHLTAPDPGGRGLECAVRAALAQAGVGPGDVDLVSAHGTGTPLNDRIEAGVLHRVLGPRALEVPVNSIKGALGHTMGAAAAFEAIMCLLAGRHGIVPPTVGFEEADPACGGLSPVHGAAMAHRSRLSLSTSLGFGGCNAALVLEAVS